MKKEILTALKSVALALLLVAGVSYAWTGPTATAPNSNTSAPVNVGTSFQSKDGDLDVAGAFSAIDGIFTGNVGVGTAAPAFKLHVSDRMKLDGSTAGLWVEADATDWFIGRSGTNGTNLRFYNGGDRMTITPTGNVGIGDATPDSGTGGQLKLDVAGNIGASQYCDASGNNCVTASVLGGGGVKVYLCPVTSQQVYGACPGSGCIGELSTQSTCTVKYSTSYNNVCRVDAGTIATKKETCAYIGTLAP